MRLIHATAIVAERRVAVERCAVVTLGRGSAQRDNTRLPCTNPSHLLGEDEVAAFRREELSERRRARRLLQRQSSDLAGRAEVAALRVALASSVDRGQQTARPTCGEEHVFQGPAQET
jgi:hypothetical protein